MGKRLLKLPRRLFGYQPASVDQLIADRDSMLTVADQRVRSAEARIAELEEELQRREEDLDAMKQSSEPKAPEESAAPALDHDQPVEPDHADEYAIGEPVSGATRWMSPVDVPEPMPAPEASLAQVDESEELDEVEEWPLPTIRPRTVEFEPPAEPSAVFDPMPIGVDDQGWSTEPEQHWATEVQADETPAPEPAFDGAQGDAMETPELHPQAADETVEPAGGEPGGTPAFTPEYMTEELAKVVKAAEESATKIIERAWESTRTQISQVDKLWREVQEEIIRFATWREHVEPMIGAVQGYIEEARARIEVVPQRIQEALGPAVEAMAFVDEGMNQFAEASSLPQLLGRMHAEIAKAIDKDEFTGSGSATPPDHDESRHGVEPQSNEPKRDATAEHHEVQAADASGPEASSNGNSGAAEGEDLDIARAIAQELRVINMEQDSGEGAVPAPESY